MAPQGREETRVCVTEWLIKTRCQDLTATQYTNLLEFNYQSNTVLADTTCPIALLFVS